MDFLVVVDAHSKWAEVKVLKRTTSIAVIYKLEKLFLNLGNPHVMITDNGPQFASHEFSRFSNSLGIEHRFTAPYHPQSNGQVERFVQIFKNALKRTKENGKPIKQNLNIFLHMYRNTPHTTTSETPAKLLFGRQLHTKLDLIHPCEQKLENKQEKMLNRHQARRNFDIGEQVLIRNLGHPYGDKFLKGEIISQEGNKSYKIQTTDNLIHHRNEDHIKKFYLPRDRSRTSSVGHSSNPTSTHTPLRRSISLSSLTQSVAAHPTMTTTTTTPQPRFQAANRPPNRPPLNQITCYNCKQQGHYANECPTREPPTRRYPPRHHDEPDRLV